ncbi:sensor histidine kinase [Arthrobacter livingstonensis]|nr:sensor histidine kinase [Arthrobacter livingstonensis]
MIDSQAVKSRRSWLIFRGTTWRQIGSDLAYLLPGFLVSLASFIILVTLFAVGVSIFVIWVGLPVLVLCLAVARGFAAANRSALVRWTGGIPPVHYKAANRRTIRGMLHSLSDAQQWKDLLHGTLVSFVFRTVAFCVTITWLGVIAGGFTKWFWRIYLPPEDSDLATILGLDTRLDMNPADAQVLLELVAAVVFVLTLPFITHLLASIDAGIARSLLTNENAALRARSAELAGSRAQVVSQEVRMLRKIERDLHDGPQQRLIRLQMDVESAKRHMARDPEAAQALMDGALEQSREALAELRALSRGIAPPILADRGLHAAVASLATRATVPVRLTSNLDDGGRLEESAENAAFFVISEALANVSKHAGATSASVVVEATAGALTMEVYDDGRGGAHVGKGHGLAGLVDRLAGVDGSMDIASPEGGPTLLRASIPLHAAATQPLT